MTETHNYHSAKEAYEQAAVILYPYNAAYRIAADLSRQIEQKKQKLSRCAHLVASRYGEEINELRLTLHGGGGGHGVYNSHVIYLRRYEQLCTMTRKRREHQQ